MAVTKVIREYAMGIGKQPKSLNNITRTLSPSFKGWNVRFSRKGVTYRKAFSDSKYSSPYKALAAAIAFRDVRVTDLPAKATAKKV